MATFTIKLSDAKARLSELADRVSAGQTVIITRRGRPILQLNQPEPERRQVVDAGALARLTEAMPQQTESAAELVREMRDQARF